MLERRGQREDAGRIHPRGEEDPCPTFGTPYAKWGLSASVERVANVPFFPRSGTREGPDTPKDTLALSLVPIHRLAGRLFSEIHLNGVLRRLMCNELDEQVRQMSQRSAER